MFRAFFLFDLRFQLRSPLLWVTVFLFSLMAFLASESIGLGGVMDQAHVNAPVAVLETVSLFTMISMFFITLFVAQPLLRDHEQGVAELFFSKPMRKQDYLLGRFAAGFCLCLALFVWMLLLMAIGFQMPWIEAKRLGDFSLMTYVYTLLLIVIPNLTFIAGGMALLASTTRSILMVYVGIIAFMGLWGASQSMIGKLDNQTLAVLLDPVGISALSAMTRYWVVADFNTRLPELTGPLLFNRVLWGGLGLAMLALAVARFKPLRSGTGRAWFKRTAPASASASATNATPVAPARPAGAPRRPVTPTTGAATALRQFFHLSWFDAVGVVKSTAFMAFALIAVFQYWINLSANLESWHVVQYPVTSWVLQIAAGPMGLMLSLVIVFYAGELIDKERAAKMHEVTAACPTPTILPLLAKCAGLMAVALAFVVVLLVTGIVFQLLHGYTRLEPELYLGGLLLELLPYLALSLLAVAIQVFTQNKYLGYGVIVVLIVLRLSAGKLGLEDNLVVFGGAPSVEYSDLNGYGNNLLPHLSLQAYWLLVSLSLLLLAASTWVRGTAVGSGRRLQLTLQALRTRLGAAVALAVLACVALGGWIFHNTHVLNPYYTQATQLDLQADYEKTYRNTQAMLQPKISAIDVALDLSPQADTLAYTVRYQVHNPHAQPIQDLHLLVNSRLALAPVAFATEMKHDRRFGLHVLRQNQPLAAGATASWEFALQQSTRGFGNRGSRSLLLQNGSFLHSYRLLPSFGYNRDGQILDPKERSTRGLPVLGAMAKLDDAAAHKVPFNSGNGVDASDDADWIHFNTVISTDPDQVALAPGYLQKEWQADGRRYFHYRMNAKMGAYAAWLSGRWAVTRDRWGSVPIEVYAHPQHGDNVQRMVTASKDALSYFSAAFSPYQHQQLRIVEFPRTVGFFAESFANTVPFSESVGFIADLRDTTQFDPVYYVTAHEVAHQWWGHQVMPANVQGATLIGESLAQYSALMVMQKTYGKAKMRQFLRRELDDYLRGRGRDTLGEKPLALVENQRHIHYSKGSLVFYRLAEEMGEEALNRALSKFLAAHAFKGPPYPTSTQLLAFIRAEAGPAHTQLIADLFDAITFYDNRVVEAKASKRPDGRFDVRFTVSSAKFYADAQGKETPATLDDTMDFAVFARFDGVGEHGEKVLHLERKRVTAASQTLNFIVDELPYEVGIDPYNKIIDRVSGDNRMRVTLQ